MLTFAATSDLHGAAHTDAQPCRAAQTTQFRLLGPQRLVPGGLHTSIERVGVATAVVRRTHRSRVWERLGRHEVAASHLDRVESDPCPIPVHRPFDIARCLGATSTAQRHGRCCVGRHRSTAGACRGDVVHASARVAQVPRDERAHRRVGAAVLHRRHLVRHDPAVRGASDSHPVSRCPAMTHPQHGLRPRLHPAHRSAQPACRPGDHDVFGLASVPTLRSEPTADVGGDGSDRARRQAECALDHILRAGRSLRTHPNGALPVVVPHGRSGARLHRPGVQTGVAHGELLDHVARRERIGLERRHRPLVRHVGSRRFVHQHIAAQRVIEIDHRRQRFGVDDHHLCGIGRLRPRLRDHDGHWFADEAHHVLRHHRARHRLVRRGEPGWKHPHVGQVCTGEHGDDTRHRRRFRRIDRQQPAVRLDRSNEHGVQGAVQLGKAQSVDERAATNDQRAVFSSVGAGQVGAHLANLSHA